MLFFEINRDNEERSPKLKLIEFDQNDRWPDTRQILPGGIVRRRDLPNGVLLESVFLSMSHRNEGIFDLKNVTTGKISAIDQRFSWR